MKLTRRTQAELILLALTIAWGSTFALTKYLFEYVSVFLYLFIRFFLATIFFGFFYRKDLKQLRSTSLLGGSVLGILLYAGFVTQTFGLSITTASKSAFITGLMVLFAPFFQYVLQRKKPSLANVIGMWIVIIGLYLLTSPKSEGLNWGDALTLVCAITFGVYIVLIDKYTKQHSPVHITFLQFIVTSVLTAPLIIVEKHYIECSMYLILIILYLTIVPTILALFLQAKYQKDTTPARSAIIYSLEPVLATGFAYVLLGEKLSISGMVGGGLIVVGVLISELMDRKPV